MPRHFQLHSHGFENSPSLELFAQQLAAALDECCDDIHSCHVFVTAPSQHHRHGRDFDVKIDLRIRGCDVCVETRPSFPGQFENGYTAVAQGFRLARRQLERELHRRRPREAKWHSEPHPPVHSGPPSE